MPIYNEYTEYDYFNATHFISKDVLAALKRISKEDFANQFGVALEKLESAYDEKYLSKLRNECNNDNDSIQKIIYFENICILFERIYIDINNKPFVAIQYHDEDPRVIRASKKTCQRSKIDEENEGKIVQQIKFLLQKNGFDREAQNFISLHKDINAAREILAEIEKYVSYIDNSYALKNLTDEEIEHLVNKIICKKELTSFNDDLKLSRDFLQARNNIIYKLNNENVLKDTNKLDYTKIRKIPFSSMEIELFKKKHSEFKLINEKLSTEDTDIYKTIIAKIYTNNIAKDNNNLKSYNKYLHDLLILTCSLYEKNFILSNFFINNLKKIFHENICYRDNFCFYYVHNKNTLICNNLHGPGSNLYQDYVSALIKFECLSYLNEDIRENYENYESDICNHMLLCEQELKNYITISPIKYFCQKIFMLSVLILFFIPALLIAITDTLIYFTIKLCLYICALPLYMIIDHKKINRITNYISLFLLIPSTFISILFSNISLLILDKCCTNLIDYEKFYSPNGDVSDLQISKNMKNKLVQCIIIIYNIFILSKSKLAQKNLQFVNRYLTYHSKKYVLEMSVLYYYFKNLSQKQKESSAEKLLTVAKNDCLAKSPISAKFNADIWQLIYSFVPNNMFFKLKHTLFYMYKHISPKIFAISSRIQPSKTQCIQNDLNEQNNLSIEEADDFEKKIISNIVRDYTRP